MTREPRSLGVKANDPKPAVLVLTSTFPRWEGDVEPPFVYELARRLTDSFVVHVLAPHAPGSKRREILDGVHVHRFRYGPACCERLAYQGGILANLKKSPALFGLVPFFLAAQLLAVIHLLMRQPIQVIHAHWIFPQGMIALLARFLSGRPTRVVCTSHGGDLYGLKGRFFKETQRRVLLGSDRVTVVSRAMRFDLVNMGADPRKVCVIPMGVDLQYRFVPAATSACGDSLLFVGRLVEKKGLRHLFEAMPLILRQRPQAQLTVVGDGPSRQELENLSLELGLRECVEFRGGVRNVDLPTAYQRAGVVVFPSVIGNDGDREGFGLVLVEAMGCGCAAVVTDLPAMRDIVSDGKTGLVVSQKNSVQLAKAVVRLMGDSELRSAIAREGRRHVRENFDWARVSRQYASLMVAIIDQQSLRNIISERNEPAMKPTEPAIWFPAIRTGSGVDVFTERLVESLNRRGIRAEISWLPHRAEYAPLSVKPVSPPAWVNVVHVNSWLPRRFIPIGLPFVATIHHVVHDPWLSRYKSRVQALYHRCWILRMEDWVVKNAARVVAVSRFTVRQALKVFPSRDIIVIPNWLNMASFHSRDHHHPHRPFRLLFVGNWSRRKGADLLPKIMQQLGGAFELRFTQGLQHRRSVGRMPANMVSLGRIEDMHQMVECYQSCDALLFPSRLEGFGLAALEAQACGLPVIATQGSSLVDVVEDGRTGLLCPMDDVEAFVAAARRLAKNPTQWREMGEAARQRVATLFSEEQSVAAYIECYRKVLGGALQHPKTIRG